MSTQSKIEDSAVNRFYREAWLPKFSPTDYPLPCDWPLMFAKEFGDSMAKELADSLRDLMEIIDYGREHTGAHFKHFAFGRYGERDHASIAAAKALLAKLTSKGEE